MKTNKMGITSDARARFFSKVDKDGPTVTHVDGLGPCWLWTASGVHGYGRMKVGGRKLYAHRLSYEIYNEPVPNGMCVLHRCDTPACVNPTHLFLGTKADNSRDCVAKERHVAPPGEQNGRARLSAAKVVEIRKLYAARGISQQKLAERFGVVQSHISLIVLRRTWAHL